jgi:hypothetical protein
MPEVCVSRCRIVTGEPAEVAGAVDARYLGPFVLDRVGDEPFGGRVGPIEVADRDPGAADALADRAQLLVEERMRGARHRYGRIGM